LPRGRVETMSWVCVASAQSAHSLVAQRSAAANAGALRRRLRRRNIVDLAHSPRRGDGVAAEIHCDSRPVKESLLTETANLKIAWRSKTRERLRTYLVEGIQDPRTNIQSILTRHFLLGQIFSDRFSHIKASELRHAARLNSARVAGRSSTDTEKDAFQKRWRSALASSSAGSTSVLECGCGSANDYRFWDAYGIARFLDYKGFDLSEDNIANAREMFPDVNFECGNIFDIRERDESFDYVVVFDLFEHLSLEGVEIAVGEACRVARRGLVLNLFNVSDIAQHVSNPVPERNYHWNTLSLRQLTESFAAHVRKVEAVNIHRLLWRKYGSEGLYDSFLMDVNQNLVTFYLEK
jgi:SAM-dependent methyltransferase